MNETHFVRDLAGAQADARLRLLGAVLAGSAGAWLAREGAGALGWTLILAFWLVALGWSASFFRQRRRNSPLALSVGPATLVLAGDLSGVRGVEAAQAPLAIAWAEIERVRVDEDRLEIVLERKEQPPLRLPGGWRGYALEEVARALDTARGA